MCPAARRFRTADIDSGGIERVLAYNFSIISTVVWQFFAIW
jgi:hypothetical protein